MCRWAVADGLYTEAASVRLPCSLYVSIGWPSMRCRCLCAKLSLVHRVSSRYVDTLLSEVYRTFSILAWCGTSLSLVKSISLVKQRRFLELSYASNFTDEILSNSVDSIRSLKKISHRSWSHPSTKTVKKPPSQKLIARLSQEAAWMKFWVAALDNGPKRTSYIFLPFPSSV